MAAMIERARLFDTALVLRDVDVGGRGPYTHLEGRAVPYDTWADVGWYLEEHRIDSLRDSTTAGKGKTLPLLLFHESRKMPIGRSVEWSSNDDGLHGLWGLNDRPEAQETARLAKSGELGWLSIGFSPIRSDWTFVDDWNPEQGPEYMDRCSRLESRLLEVSVVSTPAFVDAAITNVRSAALDEETGDIDTYQRWRTARINAQRKAAGLQTVAAHPNLDFWKRERARLER
ncbi:MAG TPA: HK97 family phage prohead protease [Acidimicrobiales bacterium]|nr:HK97 family phage prohead protease [Acidimicrobiales bacterium]